MYYINSCKDKSIQLCNLLSIKPYLWLASSPFGKTAAQLMINKVCSLAPYLNHLIEQCGKYGTMINYFEIIDVKFVFRNIPSAFVFCMKKI